MARPGITLPEAMVLPEHDLLARIFRTLGDATRLRILEYLLDHGRASQMELIAHLDVSQSRMSEHANCLVWCGFLTQQRDGRRVYYVLAEPRGEDFIGLARAFLRGNPNVVGGCTAAESLSRERSKLYGAS